jgi:tetratricopeptide (TPR) repeat protein
MTTPARIFALKRALATLAFAAVACGFAGISAATNHPADNGSATTIIGANPLLSDGASALEAGQAEEGLRLTLAGLSAPGSLHDLAAGHANACAAFVMLKQWSEALEQCNQSIEMDHSNWRAFNNRAAIYVAKGLYDLAIRDIEAGLVLAPNSQILHESMRVAKRNKRIIESTGRRSVPS